MTGQGRSPICGTRMFFDTGCAATLSEPDCTSLIQEDCTNIQHRLTSVALIALLAVFIACKFSCFLLASEADRVIASGIALSYVQLYIFAIDFGLYE